MKNKSSVFLVTCLCVIILMISGCQVGVTQTPIPPTTQPTPTLDPLASIPPEITGQVVYIPYPVKIQVDGNLSDWAGIPVYFVDRGSTLSDNPAENGSFTFALASDGKSLFITMQMPDQTIIAGQHGTEYWNEDSMEFFVNASQDLNSTKYLPGIFQVNIPAADIGNTDPNALKITGVFSGDARVSGYVFKTESGWGFEAALSLDNLVEVSHGKEIGFQTQANGASVKDRDVKLIWSKADTSDQSWEHPNLFGRALFYELGRTDVPQPSEVVAAATPAPTPEPVIIPELISVNQVGYFVDGEKLALLNDPSPDPISWSLIDSTGTQVLTGETIVRGDDPLSGDHLHLIDFTTWKTPGSQYKLMCAGLESLPFSIGDDQYQTLKKDALAYFYLNRSGIELKPEFAGAAWARPAGHLTDAEITCYKGMDADGIDWPGCDYILNAAGGWYDAGDFGKYVVNGGITAWTLMNLYEQGWDSFPDGNQSIPESGNGVSDLLDEARWEMEFLLSMQVPEGEPLAGMVHHKLHDEAWAPMPMVPPTEVDNDNANAVAGSGRYVYAPSTAATLNLAATAAQCARIWKKIDVEFSERCLTAAARAWKAALQNPAIFAGNNPGNGGGNYTDTKVDDEFYWAAAELYLTTGEDTYKTFLQSSPDYCRFESFDWGNTATLGSLSLLTHKDDLASDVTTNLEGSLQSFVSDQVSQQSKDGYFVPIKGDYPWGSNGLLLNNLMLVATEYQISGDPVNLDSVRSGMDYLLGRNTLNRSFVSGYGTYTMQHPHHRFWANDPANGFPPPPPGAVAGGVNFNPDDPAALDADLLSRPPAARYLDEIGSFTTNEVAINWNAPLVWISAFLDRYR